MDVPTEWVPFLRHPTTGKPWLIIVLSPPRVGDRVGLLRDSTRLSPSGRVIAVDLRTRRVTVEHDEGGVKIYLAQRLWREDA